MGFVLIRDGKAIQRQLEGSRTLAEILTRNEYERVRSGTFVAVTESGGLMSLDSPLAPGQVVTLRPPQPERDLAGFGFPINRAGDVVGVTEMLAIRRYEESQRQDLYELSLDEIRRRVRGSDPAPPSASSRFFGPTPPGNVEELIRALRTAAPAAPKRRALPALGRKEPAHP